MNYLKAVEGPRLLLNETEREPSLACYEGSKEGFSMWQQTLDPLYYQRPIEERFAVAMDLIYRGNGAEVSLLALTPGPLPPLAHCVTNHQAETLLHAIASGLGGRIHFGHSYWQRENYEMDAIGTNTK